MRTKYRTITALVVICLILGGISVYICKNQDTTPPVIKIKNEKITYKEGDKYDGLLKGVTAEDDHDGDVTDDIFVSQVLALGDDKAVVIYGVMDKAGNIGTAKRTVLVNQ